jgi:flagellar protein FliJ
MRFNYPLQKIVDLKGSEKAMAEWQYATALGKLREVEERMAALIREREEVEEQLAQSTVEPIPLTRVITLQHYLEVLILRAAQLAKDVRSAQIDVEVQQGKLTERMMDEKVWVNARDKALDKFKLEWLGREQNELDEIAIVRSAAAIAVRA